jgi:hypothetical protein
MPIISTLAGASARGLGGLRTFGSASAGPNDYESIASYTVTGSATSNITFSSIPNTYRHLQVRGLVRTTQNAIQNGCKMEFNGDTGSNYNWSQVYTSNGNTPVVEHFVNQSSLNLGELPSANATTSVFGFVIADIHDYTNTNKYTTYFETGGSDRNGSSQIGNCWGVWKNTSAVNSIKLFEPSSNWAVGSMFALYGIKG